MCWPWIFGLVNILLLDSSNVPTSGAFCVCIATALLQTAGLIPPPTIPTDEEGACTWDDNHLDMIRKWSAAAESLIHGRASGLDAAVCTYGTLILKTIYKEL